MRLLLVLMFLAVPAAFAQSEGPARRVIEECVASLESDTLGLEAIEEKCPGAEAALEELGVLALIPEDQLDLLTRDGLVSLNALVTRYEQAPERDAIGVASLEPLLDELRQPPVAEESLSWIERFKRWLRETFDRQSQPADGDTWLSRWLEEHPISETVWMIVIYAAMAVVVVLAILIIVNELLAAAPGRRRKRAAESAPVDLNESGAHIPPNDDERGERSSALLKKLVATLVQTGRLNSAHSLTHGELTKRARFDDSSQRDSFQKIAQLAEREVFGGQPPARDELDEVLRVGRSLDAQLQGAAT